MATKYIQPWINQDATHKQIAFSQSQAGSEVGGRVCQESRGWLLQLTVSYHRSCGLRRSLLSSLIRHGVGQQYYIQYLTNIWLTSQGVEANLIENTRWKRSRIFYIYFVNTVTNHNQSRYHYSIMLSEYWRVVNVIIIVEYYHIHDPNKIFISIKIKLNIILKPYS